MKEFVEITLEEDLYLTESLLKGTGGQACKRRHKSMLKSVINVRDSLQTSIRLEKFLTLFPALSRLLNEAWIL